MAGDSRSAHVFCFVQVTGGVRVADTGLTVTTGGLSVSAGGASVTTSVGSENALAVSGNNAAYVGSALYLNVLRGAHSDFNLIRVCGRAALSARGCACLMFHCFYV